MSETFTLSYTFADMCSSLLKEDVLIPLIVRGPGVGANMTAPLVTGHVDMAPTILQLAGVDFDPAWKLDGTAISFPFENEFDYIRNLQTRGDSTHLEFWGPVGLKSRYRYSLILR